MLTIKRLCQCQKKTKGRRGEERQRERASQGARVEEAGLHFERHSVVIIIGVIVTGNQTGNRLGRGDKHELQTTTLRRATHSGKSA